MNTRGTTLWGFVGTVVLTGLMAGSQALGLTRMNLPYMVGTMVTSNRDRAKLVGFLLHLVNGWLFAGVYAAAFQSWRRASWRLGALIGLVHALFVLAAAMPLLPSLHPRMASEDQGPTPTRQLEPPGFFALHYGRRTPASVILAHVIYGGILGAFYRLKDGESR
ncbi:MAG TPA: hypothetical protein VM450_10490 [Thermomicrobiales bacterium]|nr:hypothetical protein [Thermomicrobiales bacterium]